MTNSYDVLGENSTPLVAEAKRRMRGELGPLMAGVSRFAGALEQAMAADPSLAVKHLEIMDWRAGTRAFGDLSVASQIFCEQERANADLAERWEAERETAYVNALQSGQSPEEAANADRLTAEMHERVTKEVDEFIESVALPHPTKWATLELWLADAAKRNPDLTAEQVYTLASTEAPPELIAEYVSRFDKKPEPDKPEEPQRKGWAHNKPKVSLGMTKAAAPKQKAEMFGFEFDNMRGWKFDGVALVDGGGMPLLRNVAGLFWDTQTGEWVTPEIMVARIHERGR